MSDTDATLTVTLDHLSKAQVVALQEFFSCWEVHGKIGASRKVAFYVDGDGAFHPEVSYDVDGIDVDDVPDEVRDEAEVRANVYDFDPVSRALSELEGVES